MSDSTAQFKEIIEKYVQQIWAEFDNDGNDCLDREETKEFVKKMLTEVGESTDFSDDEFNKCFEEFDTDGNGTVDKQEMKDFIMKICGL